MLKLQFRDRRRESVWLVDKNFTIGKASENSLVINDPSVLDHHISLTNELDQITVNNTSQSSKVLVNGKPVAISTKISANDVLTLGSVELELIDPKSNTEKNEVERTTNYVQGWSIYSNASWLDQQRFLLGKKTIIGRDPSCDITLPLEHLSRKHVSIEIINGQLFLKDLDSSNGTFVNGNPASQIQLHPGDKIKLDVVTFEVSGPAKAHDPNKTIIRTAPAAATSKKPPSKSRLTTKVENPAPPTKKPAKKPVAKKRLASDGKQDWISNKQEDVKTDPPSSKKTVFVLGIAVVVIGLAIASTLVIL